MASGDIKLSSNFELNSQRALDARINVASIDERDGLPIIQRYDRMIVSVRGGETYQLKLGTVDFDLANNLNWFSIDISAYLKLQAIVDSYGLTGFVDGENIDVSYDYTTRTITLTGNLTYYFRGLKKELTSPWTSPAHPDVIAKYFLYSTDGINFIWLTTAWKFKDTMAAFVNYDVSQELSFGVREPHGLMDQQTHESLHKWIGTYKVSGGLVTSGTYIENSALDTSTTPGFDASVVKDEDLASNIAAWIQGNYTLLHVGAAYKATFTINSLFPFLSSGSFLSINNPLTGTLSNGINNRYYNVYQIIAPTTSDNASQKFRTILLQPQVAYTTLQAAQSEDVNSLSLGDLGSLVPEFVFHARITYITATGDTNTGKCRIATNGITYLSGSKASQVSISGFTANNHATLTNREWTISEHIGTPNKIAGFGVSGEAVELDNLLHTQNTDYKIVGLAQHIVVPGINDIVSVPGGGTFWDVPLNQSLTQKFRNEMVGGQYLPSFNQVGVWITGLTDIRITVYRGNVGGQIVLQGTFTLGGDGTWFYLNGAVLASAAEEFTIEVTRLGASSFCGVVKASTAYLFNAYRNGVQLETSAYFLVRASNIDAIVDSGAKVEAKIDRVEVTGDLHIFGDIIQNGSAYETHAEQLYTEKDLIILREKAISSLATNEYSGFKITKYNGTNNLIFATDRSGIARIGDEGGALQALATREDTPIDGGYARWNATTLRFETVNLSGVFAASVHTHDYAASVHTHDYAASNHTHSYLPLAGGTLTGNLGIYTSGQLRFYNTANNNYSLINSPKLDGDTTGDINFITSHVNALYIKYNGNVGIGTQTPIAKLDVNGSIYANGNILSDFYGGYSGVDTKLSTNTSGAARLIFETALSEKMTILNNGYVGIGTSSPGTKVSISGALEGIPSLGSAGGSLSLLSQNGLYGLYSGIVGTGNSWFQSQRNNEATAYSILLNPNGGNVGIGLTDPNFKLTVKEAISVRDTSLPKYQLYVNSTPKGSLFFSGSYVGLYTLYNDNGLRIYEDGHSTFPGTVTANDFINVSDMRLKKNIKDLNMGVSNLKPKSFIFKDDKFSGVHYGFIAQDMIIDYPELVQTDREGMLSIKQNSIIALLVYQVNQQEQKINELTNFLNTTK